MSSITGKLIALSSLTATRRAEPLQETPVAITVMTAGQIDMAFSANIAAMPFLAPNVNVSNGLLSNQATPSISGYTLTDVDSTIDPSVATMVNEFASFWSFLGREIQC
jgi:iron complex outermembrane receptor protein